MRSRDRKLVNESWTRMLLIQDSAGECFYERLFAVAPGLRPLFRGDMRQQSRMLMQMINLAVSSLGNLAQIRPALRELGRRHYGYGARPEHYPLIGETLLWTLEQGLGEHFDQASREAWQQAYRLMSEEMLKGAAEAEEAGRAALPH